MIVRYNGRNQDTPRYMPVTEREYIMPMHDEFSGPYRGFTWAVLLLACLIFWTAVFAWVFA